MQMQMLLRSVVRTACTCTLLLSARLHAASASSAPIAFAVLPSQTYGTWEGWGVSLAWSGVVWGSSVPLADALFSLQDAVQMPDGLGAVPGLGLNIARFNVGGSSNATAGGDRMQLSPNIPWWKQAHGFQLDWTSNDVNSSSWDFTTDTNQVAMMRAAKARGANHFEFFSNSPMWWMLNNHNPSGSNDGSSDNLQSWNYQNHARYMAQVAAWSRDVWGILPTSLELFNEPIANWWKASGTQEGCHFDASTQAAVLAALPAELASVGLAGQLRVAASDESQVDMALATWRAFNSSTRALIDQLNVHGYQQG
jgi:galactan endo-1,6-beta-galactosidase